MKCPRCGKILGEADRFCKSCGLAFAARPILDDIGVKKGFILAAAIGIGLACLCRFVSFLSFFVFTAGSRESLLFGDPRRVGTLGEVDRWATKAGVLFFLAFIVFLFALAFDQLKRPDRRLGMGALLALALLTLGYVPQLLVEVLEVARARGFFSNLLLELTVPAGLVVFAVFFALHVAVKHGFGILGGTALAVILMNFSASGQYFAHLFYDRKMHFYLLLFKFFGLAAMAALLFLLILLYLNQVRLERWQRKT